MPGGDGTGPAGMGAMTGRAAGFCAGFGRPGYANYGGGRGFGGRGGGRGWRNRFFATGLPGWARGGSGYGAAPYGPAAYQVSPQSPQEEVADLKGQAEYLKDTLKNITQRIEDIESNQQS